jgi:hypothetical protein
LSEAYGFAASYFCIEIYAWVLFMVRVSSSLYPFSWGFMEDCTRLCSG